MDISILVFDSSLEAIRANIERTSREGFSGCWMPNATGYDALTALAAVGSGVNMRLGSAVVPVHPRHPVALAQQALTVNRVLDGNLALGVGLSHPLFVERSWGLSYDRPVAYMAEYLEILIPLLEEGRAFVRGERLSMRGELTIDAPACPVLVAALGPRMLKLTGRVAAGTITWMVGAETIRDLTAPTINEAAAAAGRGAPEVVVGLPVCVSDDLEGARARAGHSVRMYGKMPSYRAMLDREGLDDPGDLCVVGTESQVAEQLAAFFEAGATSIAASPTGTPEEVERTRACLAALVR